MTMDRLEDVCKQLRLSHILRAPETSEFETKEEWCAFSFGKRVELSRRIEKVATFQTS